MGARSIHRAVAGAGRDALVAWYFAVSTGPCQPAGRELLRSSAPPDIDGHFKLCGWCDRARDEPGGRGISAGAYSIDHVRGLTATALPFRRTRLVCKRTVSAAATRMRSMVALLLALLLALALVAGACSTADGQGQGVPSGDEAWRTAALRDVVTGEEFRIVDLRGKVVVIEAMAIWCFNCRLQQAEAQAALEQVASPDVVYISLDLDPNERAEDLSQYARREGFGWRFVVASPELSRSLAATFGDQVLSPPATPLIILGPDGALIEKHVGIKSAGDLAALIEEHLP
jgi:predicted small secreted protein